MPIRVRGEQPGASGSAMAGKTDFDVSQFYHLEDPNEPDAVHDQTGLHIPGYHGLAVTGRCGQVYPDRTNVVERTYPGGVYPFYRGEYFDPATWDGSDLFTGAKGVSVYFTARVRDVFRAYGIGNVEFRRITEIEIDKALAERLWSRLESGSS
jgi:hypothetical protein